MAGLFSNDMRVANTATPSFERMVNVGQMGWTKADTSNYNQLIEYVDLVQQVYKDTLDVSDQVNELLDRVIEMQPQLNEAVSSIYTIRDTAAYVTGVQTDITAMSNNITPMYNDFVPKYNNFLAQANPRTEYPPIMNGWSLQFFKPKATKIHNIVFLEGFVKREHGMGTEDMVTLSTDFRPKSEQFFTVPCNNGVANIRVGTDGVITMRWMLPGGTEDWINLSCSFTTL